MHIKDIINENIIAIIPIYEGGNATKIITMKNEYIKYKRVKTIIRKICSYYALHLSNFRNRYGKILNKRLGIPIVINKNLILIPVKIRIPKFQNDGAFGYINYAFVKETLDYGQTTEVLMEDGKKIIVLQKHKILARDFNNAKIILNEERHINHRENLFNKNQVATVDHIGRLYMEIMELKEMIGKISKK